MIELLLGGLIIGFVAGYAYRGHRDRDDRDEIEGFLEEKVDEVQGRYYSTIVDDEESLEYDLLVLQEPGTELIIRSAVDVDGVGPETALDIAMHFGGDYAAFANADVDEFQTVNGVGEQRSRALATHH